MARKSRNRGNLPQIPVRCGTPAVFPERLRGAIDGHIWRRPLPRRRDPDKPTKWPRHRIENSDCGNGHRCSARSTVGRRNPHFRQILAPGALGLSSPLEIRIAGRLPASCSPSARERVHRSGRSRPSQQWVGYKAGKRVAEPTPKPPLFQPPRREKSASRKAGSRSSPESFESFLVFGANLGLAPPSIRSIPSGTVFSRQNAFWLAPGSLLVYLCF